MLHRRKYNLRGPDDINEENGTGCRRSPPVINEADRTKLYTFVFRNPETPLGLANKVQSDIMLFFFRLRYGKHGEDEEDGL